MSPVVGQSDCARCGCLTIFPRLPRFDLRQTLVPGIKSEPPPSLQWWRRLSAVARMLTRWSSGKGGIEFEDANKRPQSQISHHEPPFLHGTMVLAHKRRRI